MPTNVEVPAAGESITEAILVRWHKREGDRVAVDEPICELETDKATVDLPAPVGGVLHPVKQAGETVQVG
ncbi:MAG TPA: lipoyl domain-containing protein, partial [Pirellulales bacterium]|nr:lipoyl domain-containing protein [Pirellulales bacterium]